MSQTNNQQEGLSVELGDELSKSFTVHKNVKQEIIITTADKIKIVLMETKEILSSQKDWWTPFGLFISFIATLLTADFKDAFSQSKDFWKSSFVLLTIGSALWLIYSLYQLYKNWGQGELKSIIQQIKLKDAPVTEQTQQTGQE